MSNELKGNIFDIQHFSIGDGPGIRTTVFLKGCPLNCVWCHNPESKISRPQVMYNKHHCINCAACTAVCPNGCHRIDATGHSFDSGNCTGCGRCVAVCRFGSLEIAGRSMSVVQVISEVEEDIVFYESSQGGMTLSGGEPLYQPEFSIALAKAAKKKQIHVCVETSGFGKTDSLLELARYTDLFLFDYKATGQDHEQFIGVDNTLILRNLFSIDSIGAEIILRCPIIPGKNANEAHINGIVNTAKQIKNLVGIDLEPYHNIGIGKLEQLGINCGIAKIAPPSNQFMHEIADRIEAAFPEERHTPFVRQM